jgi:hypothetical protein
MLCERESLLMKSTRAPTATSMLLGLTPADEIVMVVVWTAVTSVGAVTEELPLLPHAAAAMSTARAAARRVFQVDCMEPIVVMGYNVREFSEENLWLT